MASYLQMRITLGLYALRIKNRQQKGYGVLHECNGSWSYDGLPSVFQ
jgi:hypothetical protein